MESLKSFYFKDLLNLPWYAIVAVVLLVIIGVALLKGGKQKWTTKRLAYASLCLAIAYVLSCIRLYRMPSGGSVVLCSILPLVAFAVYCNLWQGVVLGVAYGLLQMLQGAWIVHPVQGFLDYVAAYAVLAFGALAARLPIAKRLKLPAALLLASILRFIVHVASGMVFFASDAIDAGQAPLIYSSLYNTFLFPEAILSMIVALIPGVQNMFDRTLGDSVNR